MSPKTLIPLLLLSLLVICSTVRAQTLPDETERLIKQGTVALQKRDLKAAATAFQQTVQSLPVQKDSKEYNSQTVRLHLRIGQLCGQFAAYELSEQYARRTLALSTQFQNEAGKANAYKMIGDILTRTGRFDEARIALETARTLYVANKNLLQIAQTDASLGYYYRRIARYDLAIIRYLAALPIFEREGDIRSAASGYEGFGSFYCQIGQPLRGKQQFEKALRLWEMQEKQNASLSEMQKLQLKQGFAYTYSNLGVAYELLGEFQESRRHHELALKLREEINNPQDIGKSLANLAGLAMTEERYIDAIAFQERALALYRERSKDDDMIARTLDNLGKLFLLSGKPTEAKSYLDDALILRREFKNPHEIIETLISLVEFFLQTNNLPEAEKHAKEATVLQDELLMQIADPSQVGILQETTGRLYSVAAQVALRKNRPMDALLWIERGRAVGLARQVTLSNTGLARYLTPEQNAELTKWNSEFITATRRLQAAYNEVEPTEPTQLADYQARVKETKQNYAQAEEALTRFRAKIFGENAILKQLRGIVPLTAKELQALAKANPDTLYLVWNVQDNRILTFAFHNGKPLTVSDQSVPQKRLTQTIAKWRETLTRPRAANTANREKQAAQQLYRWLLAPMEQRGHLAAKSIKRIVFCGEGALTELPIAALMDSKGQRLISRYSLSSTVSLGMQTWKLAQQKPTASLLCVADPCGEGGQILARADFDREFGALPNARTEGRAIAQRISGTKLLIGAEAREETIRASMPKYALLHFATHGWVDSVDPFRSCLILAPSDKEGTGVLEARSVLELPLSAYLAVLSACETGRGEATQGDGILGLVWAFRAAGCPNVIASHWSVNDAATRLLMVAFYEKLRSGARIDDALRHAMQTLQKHPFYNAPYYWAGFQLYGSGKALPPQLLTVSKSK